MAKIPYGEKSWQRKLRTAKNPYGKKSYSENSYGKNFNAENSGHDITVATLKENFWLNWVIDFYQAIKKN